MAKTLLLGSLTILALTLGAPSCGTAQTPATPPGDSLRLAVDGMVCSLCAYGVERRLKKLDQVQRVEVELDSGLVVLVLKPGAALADSALAREVRKAGFALRAVDRFTRNDEPGS